MPAEGLEDFCEGLRSWWGWQASAGGCWGLPADPPPPPSHPAAAFLHPPHSHCQLLSLLRACQLPSFPAGWVWDWEEPSRQAAQETSQKNTNIFSSRIEHFRQCCQKNPPQTQQTRELCPKKRILDPMETARWNDVRGWEVNWKRCREGPPGRSGEQRKPAESQVCFHSWDECWGEVG